MKQFEAGLDNWHFAFHETGLSPSDDIEKLAQECGLFRAPTIVFCQNDCVITEKSAQVSLVFNAKRALEFINYEKRAQSFVPCTAEPQPNSISYLPERLFVKHAEHWKSIEKPKDIEITEIKESSDSFFLTPFKGHI